MKLERQDTKPLNDNADFSSLIRDDSNNGSINLSFSRINTEDLNAITQIVGLDTEDASVQQVNDNTDAMKNEHPQVMISVDEESTQNELCINQDDVLSYFTDNLVINNVPINWPTNIESSTFPEQTITEVSSIVRGLTLPPSTSTFDHGMKQEVQSSTCAMPPSLLSWPGNKNFNISVFTDNKDRNKVSYSAKFNKLYVSPNYIVPVSISLDEWEGASLTVVPVYKQKQHHRTPVTRCHNCKTTVEYDTNKNDHIIHVEDETAEYKLMQEHHVVTLPLTSPSMGEYTSTILIKSTCLNSCQGGPCRKPFCIVFICNINGVEAGRQVLEVKCCRCPGRDRDNDEREGDKSTAENKKTKVTKIKIADLVEGKSNKRLKTESNDSSGYTTIRIPKEYESEVKKLINRLEAEKYVRRNNPNALPFPEESKD